MNAYRTPMNVSLARTRHTHSYSNVSIDMMLFFVCFFYAFQQMLHLSLFHMYQQLRYHIYFCFFFVFFCCACMFFFCFFYVLCVIVRYTYRCFTCINQYYNMLLFLFCFFVCMRFRTFHTHRYIYVSIDMLSVMLLCIYLFTSSRNFHMHRCFICIH